MTAVSLPSLRFVLFSLLFRSVPFSSLHPDSLAGNQSFFAAKLNLIPASTIILGGPSTLERLSCRCNDANRPLLAAVTVLQLSLLLQAAHRRFPVHQTDPIHNGIRALVGIILLSVTDNVTDVSVIL